MKQLTKKEDIKVGDVVLRDWGKINNGRHNYVVVVTGFQGHLVVGDVVQSDGWTNEDASKQHPVRFNINDGAKTLLVEDEAEKLSYKLVRRTKNGA